VTTGRKIKPAEPMPELISNLAEKGRLHCPDATEFNQCILTKYPPKAGIGWHTDAPLFGECIMAVSLGTPATVFFRQNGTESPSFEFEAEPGSLYVFHGEARWNYQHCVAPVTRTRYSLTFRFVDPNRY
jgi:alkylated DNA repair dioxygenase AlkB